MEPFLIPALVALALALCSTIGGCVAWSKKRNPGEGLMLGLLLGPIGVAIECRFEVATRPRVDEAARRSFRSMTAYQGRPGSLPGRPGG